MRSSDAFGPSAARYERTEMSRYIADWVLGMGEPDDDDRMLDLGCGPGTLTKLLAPHVAQVVGTDITPAMLERYRVNTSGTAVAADAELLPFDDGAFSLVVSGGVFHHLSDPQEAICEVARVLRPGGRFVLIDMAGPEHPRRRAIRDEVERARDPSHEAILAPSQVSTWMFEACLDLRAEERQVEDKRDVEWVALMGGDLAYVREIMDKHRDEAAGFLALREEEGAFWFRRERAYYCAVRTSR
jgi:ubiquinone/menaquinone biosynthesis C-methylase UbiE